MTENKSGNIGHGGALPPRREIAAWVIVGVVAATMRSVHLGWAPLTAVEAREATLAWERVAGQGLLSDTYSPFLLAGNSLVFTLLGAGDALARLWPAIFGTALALCPALLRRRLGRVGALGAGLYLALSPTALVASRQVDGTIIATAGVMALIGGLTMFADTRRRGWLWFAAVGLALGLVSSSVVYGLVVPLGAAWIVKSEPWADDWSLWLARKRSWLESYGVEFVVALIVGFLALSTGFGWNPSGIGAVGGVFVDWVRWFELPQVPGAAPMTLLATYELAGLAWGVGGLIWSWYRRRPWAAFLTVWAGAAYFLVRVTRGGAPTDLIVVVLPLAILTGLAVEWLGRGRWASQTGIRVAYGAFVLVLWAQVYLMLARHALYGQSGDLALAGVIVLLQLLLVASFGFVLGPRATLRTWGAATSLVFLGLLISAGTGVAYRRTADPREALVGQPTAVNIRDLVDTLVDLSWHRTGLPITLDFVYEAPADSVLAWYMRDFERARRVDHLAALTADSFGPLVVTVDDAPGPAIAPGPDYVGQAFALQRQWVADSLPCRLWQGDCRIGVRWFLFRDGPPLPEPVERAVLWREIDTTAGLGD